LVANQYELPLEQQTQVLDDDQERPRASCPKGHEPIECQIFDPPRVSFCHEWRRFVTNPHDNLLKEIGYIPDLVVFLR
jgi:hypothetical protein